MGISPKVSIKETFVRVKKLLETHVNKIKDLFIWTYLQGGFNRLNT